jgi:hypothetical protein
MKKYLPLLLAAAVLVCCLAFVFLLHAFSPMMIVDRLSGLYGASMTSQQQSKVVSICAEYTVTVAVILTLSNLCSLGAALYYATHPRQPQV